MKTKTPEGIDEIAVIGVDIGKDTFHLVGFDHSGRHKNATGPISRSEESSANIMTIPGIGPLISTAIVAAIGKGDVFDRGRDFAAWVGLVPRQFSTGGRTILGRISKRGNNYLRMLSVQTANVILLRPHRWDVLGLGPWLRGVVGRMPHNKAAVVLANKLARTAWSVLRHGSKYAVQRDEALGAI